MRIKYNASVEDTMALIKFQHKHSKVMRRFNLTHGLAIPLAIFVFFSVLSILDGDWYELVIFWIIFGLFMLWAFGGHKRRFAKLLKKMHNESPQKAPLQELELGENGLTSRTEDSESYVKWSAIEKIGFSRDYTFILASRNTGLAIQRMSVIEGDYDVFTEELKSGFIEKAELNKQGQLDEKIIVETERTYSSDKDKGGHSKIGIASFIISMAVLGIYMTTFLILKVLSIASQGMLNSESLTLNIAAGVFILGGIASLLGIGFGFTGITQKNRKKTFAVLGLIFNAVVLAGFILLVVLKSP